MSTALLETRDLSVDLSGRTIVNNVHVQVVPGELVGLVGPNGAGKSTLVRLLAGLQRPTRGSILLQGQPIHRIPRRERSRLIGYVPQDTRIDFPLSVEQVVLLGRHAHRSGLVVDSAHDYALAAAALERVGLLHLRDRAVSSLSGGERQLVMLARAICSEPKLLLLDEPVSALDLRHQLHALAITRDVIGDCAGGIAVLHDLNLAARFCDRILVMQGGMVRAEGEPSMVLAPSLLRDAYGVGVAVRPDDLIDSPSVVAVRHVHPRRLAVAGQGASLVRVLAALFRHGCLDVTVITPAESESGRLAANLGFEVVAPSAWSGADHDGIETLVVGHPPFVVRGARWRLADAPSVDEVIAVLHEHARDGNEPGSPVVHPGPTRLAAAGRAVNHTTEVST